MRSLRPYQSLSALTFIPLRRLVEEEHNLLCVINLELLLDRLVFLKERIWLTIMKPWRYKTNG